MPLEFCLTKSYRVDAMSDQQQRKTEPKKLTAVSLPLPLLERAEALAEKQHTSVSSVLIRCVEGHLDRMEQAEEWCAVEGSNLRPPPCQGIATPESSATPSIVPIKRLHDSRPVGSVIEMPLPLHTGLATAA